MCSKFNMSKGIQATKNTIKYGSIIVITLPNLIFSSILGYLAINPTMIRIETLIL